MKRQVSGELHQWLAKTPCKPLVIRGARQVGKTWLVRDLARSSQRSLIELNFERDPLLAELFQSNDPHQILKNLELHQGRRILPENTILFLDEIQAAPHLLAKLRWFYEELPTLPLIAAGSLLDFALADHTFSMPVGRIRYLYLEPLSFDEFLNATDQTLLAQELETINPFQSSPQQPPGLHKRLMEEYRSYLLVGGMPEAVESWCTHKSFIACAEIHQALLDTYRDDFSKYAGRIPNSRLARVFESIPRLLGRKFKYASVSGDEKSTAIKHALNLLLKARLCYRISASHARGIPLGAETQEKVFKIGFIDSGLASTALGLWQGKSFEHQDIALVNEGALAEQSVAQALRTLNPSFQDPSLYYWSREQRGSEAELDFIIQYGPQIIPIEVKAGATGSLKSLHLFMAERQLPIAIRINADSPSFTSVDTRLPSGANASYQLLSLPFYLCSQIYRLCLLYTSDAADE